MRHGVISSTWFTLGGLDLCVDLQDNSYYGERACKYYVPSTVNPDCFGIDCNKQFRTYEKCEHYIRKCVIATAKRILKETI